MENSVTTLGVCQDKARNKCVSRSNYELSELNRTYVEVFHVVSDTLHPIWNNFNLITTADWGGPGYLILSNSNMPGISNREKFESILSVFALGLNSIKRMIFEGSYVQSCTLLRSSIETMVQLRKILEDKYVDKQTPRVSNLDEKLRRVYSDLTGLAHLSDSEFLSHITKGSYDNGEALLTPLLRTLTPQFNDSLSQFLFSIHIVCAIETILLIDEYLNANIPQNAMNKSVVDRLKDQCLTIWKQYLTDEA
ncbi:hypothetical protein ACE1OG_06280 [Aeromonas hydrophila]|uniref:hypothetical protein n=1 Tax=Aeromonas hydrophila TaxID=644 RepID=UPI001A927760|nr:hypothetical protein [Aeromonas hydrophila]MBO0405766.1 hypothetical protein [Aeromonas hydrophila]